MRSGSQANRARAAARDRSPGRWKRCLRPFRAGPLYASAELSDPGFPRLARPDARRVGNAANRLRLEPLPNGRGTASSPRVARLRPGRPSDMRADQQQPRNPQPRKEPSLHLDSADHSQPQPVVRVAASVQRGRSLVNCELWGYNSLPTDMALDRCHAHCAPPPGPGDHPVEHLVPREVGKPSFHVRIRRDPDHAQGERSPTRLLTHPLRHRPKCGFDTLGPHEWTSLFADENDEQVRSGVAVRSAPVAGRARVRNLPILILCGSCSDQVVTRRGVLRHADRNMSQGCRGAKNAGVKSGSAQQQSDVSRSMRPGHGSRILGQSSSC